MFSTSKYVEIGGGAIARAGAIDGMNRVLTKPLYAPSARGGGRVLIGELFTRATPHVWDFADFPWMIFTHFDVCSHH